MLYELWHSEDEKSYVFIKRDREYEASIFRHLSISPDLKIIWSFQAKSHFQAMQAYYDHLGWGTYKPEADWEDIYYTDENN